MDVLGGDILAERVASRAIVGDDVGLAKCLAHGVLGQACAFACFAAGKLFPHHEVERDLEFARRKSKAKRVMVLA